MSKIEQPMDRLAMRPIDLGLVGAPFGALPGHSTNNQTTEKTSILVATANDIAAERVNPLKSLWKQSAKIDALSIACLFGKCSGNLANGAPSSPKSIGSIADRSISYSILDTVQPQDCRSKVEFEWRWQFCSSATVRFAGRRHTPRPPSWSVGS